MKLGFMDIYINVPGEFSFHDAGMDLSIAAAIMSQYHDKPLDTSTVFVGELGLTGHVTKARSYDKRIAILQDDTLQLVDHTTLKHIVELRQYL